MPKVENAPVATSRELLPIKATAASVNAKHHLNKEVVIDMDDSLTFQDLLNDPRLFRLIQKDRARALCDDDRVTLRWHGQRVHTSVDYADPDQVLLFKAPVLTRRERDRTPWQNDSFEVRAVAGGWSYFRRADNIRMSNASWSNWESARDACNREQASVRVA